MLEAAVRADLVSGEQMTERKLALVCQSRVALLCAAGWRGRCACWLMSKAVLLAVLLVAGWSGAGSLVPFQSRVWMSQTHVAVSAGRENHGGTPQSQGLVLTLPAAACCVFLQRQPLPPSNVSAPLLEQGSGHRGWQVFLGTANPFIPLL